MPSIITDDGRDWVADRLAPDIDETDLYYVALGTGTSLPESENDEINNEVFRANDDDNTCSITRSSNLGEISISLTISGGTEIDGGTNITEIGVLTAENELVYHEVRQSIEIESGVQITLNFPINVIDV